MQWLHALVVMVNMALDEFFVLALGWNVAGMAGGAVIAEYLGIWLSLFLRMRILRGYPGQWN